MHRLPHRPDRVRVYVSAADVGAAIAGLEQRGGIRTCDLILDEWRDMHICVLAPLRTISRTWYKVVLPRIVASVSLILDEIGPEGLAVDCPINLAGAFQRDPSLYFCAKSITLWAVLDY